MASAFDVVACLLQQHGRMTTMKLQKLLYYGQAWSLVWDEAPLFPEPIEAWASGPVVPEVSQWHKGRWRVATCRRGDASQLTQVQRDTLGGVLGHYGPLSPQQLTDLTHVEEPWRQARRGLRPGDSCTHRITNASMLEYYASLPIR